MAYIVTVPTPIDRYKRPDLSPLLRASETLGKVLKPGDVVIYESTVYPGATEEDCVPVLETVAPNDALLASMLEMVLLHGFIKKGTNDRCSLLEGDRHG